MVKIASLPYSLLKLHEWTVTALFAENELTDNQGLPLDNLVYFNPDRVDTNEINSDTEYRYLDLSCVSSSTGLITTYHIVVGNQLPARAKLKVKAGDILLSTVRPERNLAALVTEEYDGCIVNSSFAVLRPKKIASEVLYFIVRSPKVNKLLCAKAKGTSIPTLKLKDLKELKISIDNIDEETVNRANNLYLKWVNQNKSIKTAQEIVEEKFIEFQFIRNAADSKMKTNVITLPYDQLGDRFDVSYYLDKPQQNWSIPTDPLAHLVKEFQSGITIPAKEYQAEGVAYIRIQDIQKTRVSRENLAFVDKHYSEENQKNRLNFRDILISRVGTIGKSALITKDLEGSLANQHLTIVRVNEKMIHPEFLVLYLNTRWATEQLEAKASGTAQRFIKLGDIKELKVPVPPMGIQLEIIDEVSHELKEMDTSKLEQELSAFIQSILG